VPRDDGGVLPRQLSGVGHEAGPSPAAWRETRVDDGALTPPHVNTGKYVPRDDGGVLPRRPGGVR